MNMPNGTTTTRAYDAVGRLSEIKHTAPDGNILFSETSRYDDRNRRIARQHADGSADRFAYDPAGQVIAAAYGQPQGEGLAKSPPNEPGVAANFVPVSTPQAPNFKPSQTFDYDLLGTALHSQTEPTLPSTRPIKLTSIPPLPLEPPSSSRNSIHLATFLTTTTTLTAGTATSTFSA
ncbi:MAG: RHS repeat protein [Verrucomicrobiaceae bacterium]|nr:RHS repeat protein [Verrucomicrobiaceae bacterium]